MHRFDQRQGFLVSAILHLTLLMVVIAHPLLPRKPDEIDPSTLERKDLVFLPPAAVLRQLAPKLPPGRPERDPKDLSVFRCPSRCPFPLSVSLYPFLFEGPEEGRPLTRPPVPPVVGRTPPSATSCVDYLIHCPRAC